MPVQLRPATESDLPHLTGGDSPYDSFGPHAARTSLYDPALRADFGGLVIDEDGVVLGNLSWVWQRWGPNPESRNPMIGIWLAAPARGRGIGSAAQAQLVDLFFLHTTTHRVEAHTDVENLAEQRALERAGFIAEATIRSAQWREGGYHDMRIYSVLREQWALARSTTA